MRGIISYDVSDDRRRARVVKRLRRCARRVQYSVFEGDLETAEWARLWADLNTLIKPTLDGLLLVPLCEGCTIRRQWAGTTGTWEGGGDVVI